ncbi:hypothetical protein D0Z00_003947 [Geotrichum galactomycetum]|uniref:Uncharacterized protein n=1 Tax=Geotrichum galactomycetum TaxID=27317 RepID=A0ACB6UZV5_9ASCO|nr:hypothetical protein D0Z00_003947 [Geotrichum candidum]
MHRPVLSAGPDDLAADPLQGPVTPPTDHYSIYQDLRDDNTASSSDDDADGPAEQDTLTIRNINLSNSRSVDTLKDTPLPRTPAAPAAEPAKPRSPAPKLDKLDTSQTTLHHRKHRATHSASSASSAGAPHHQYFHLNLPPCSPSLASPQSPTPHSIARSPSPRRRQSHRPMSSIGSTLSSTSSGSVAPGKFVFPPPTPSAQLPAVEPELDLDYSLCFSPALSDEGGASPYILQAQNDLQGIFTTLAHKERRLLEAREQLKAAEKDLSQFKSQWDTVLGSESSEAPSPNVEPPLSPDVPVEPVATATVAAPAAPATPELQPHNHSNHKKTSSVSSAPDSSTRSRRMLPMRHSIGHASELGFDFSKATDPGPFDPKDPASSFLGNFSYYFREKLNGLFEQQQQQLQLQQQRQQDLAEKHLETKDSVTSLRSAASFHTLSPATSLSSLSLNEAVDGSSSGGGGGTTSDSFIGRFLVNPASTVDHHSALFAKSAFSVRSPPYLSNTTNNNNSRLASPPTDPLSFASVPISTPKKKLGDPLRSPFVAKQA